MDEHLAPRERLLAAEAKLVGSLAVLVWLLPLVFVVELILAANGLIAEASFGNAVASVLRFFICFRPCSLADEFEAGLV